MCCRRVVLPIGLSERIPNDVLEAANAINIANDGRNGRLDGEWWRRRSPIRVDGGLWWVFSPISCEYDVMVVDDRV